MKVLFFAQLRERLNCDSADIELALPAQLSQVRIELINQFPDHADLLKDGKALAAINQELINDENTTISAGDEVAFFPPVTGG